jgi:hypothetical protein
MRDRPSTKARERSYIALCGLHNLLDMLMVSHPMFEDELNNIFPDFKGWKAWVNKHTPLDKRGGPSKH